MIEGRQAPGRGSYGVDVEARVLRPGGRLLIADIWSTGRYSMVLDRLGMADLARRGPGWRVWWSGPWVATRLVSARKPAVLGPRDPAAER